MLGNNGVCQPDRHTTDQELTMQCKDN